MRTMLNLIVIKDQYAYKDKYSEVFKIFEDFCLLVVMNPTTNIAKQDITSGLQSCFTESYVNELVNPVYSCTGSAPYKDRAVFTYEISLVNSETI